MRDPAEWRDPPADEGRSVVSPEHHPVDDRAILDFTRVAEQGSHGQHTGEPANRGAALPVWSRGAQRQSTATIVRGWSGPLLPASSTQPNFAVRAPGRRHVGQESVCVSPDVSNQVGTLRRAR